VHLQLSPLKSKLSPQIFCSCPGGACAPHGYAYEKNKSELYYTYMLQCKTSGKSISNNRQFRQYNTYAFLMSVSDAFRGMSRTV